MDLRRWRRAPARALTPELRWVLQRGFASPQAVVAAPIGAQIDGRRAATLAGNLGLVERIATRVDLSTLAAELGVEPARELALARLQDLARTQRLSEFIPEFAEDAATASIPIVLLKFAALQVGGYLATGSRAASDIDVLVRERDAPRTAEILVRRGFFPVKTAPADHHLPPLQDPLGRVVEIHTSLPGLRAPGARRFARFDELLTAGVLNPAPGLGSNCHVLEPDFLAVHAIVHGFAHHGGADPYPLTRALADVIDVFPAGRRGKRLAAAPWVASDVPVAELQAVLGLCDALEQGDLDEPLDRPESSAESALLDHVLASALDADYRRSLTLRYLYDWMSDQPPWWRFLAMVQSRVLPTDAQLAARLGLPSGESVNFRHRLAHTAALARRLPEFARPALLLLRRRGGSPVDDPQQR